MFEMLSSLGYVKENGLAEQSRLSETYINVRCSVSKQLVPWSKVSTLVFKFGTQIERFGEMSCEAAYN